MMYKKNFEKEKPKTAMHKYVESAQCPRFLKKKKFTSHFAPKEKV